MVDVPGVIVSVPALGAVPAVLIARLPEARHTLLVVLPPVVPK